MNIIAQFIPTLMKIYQYDCSFVIPRPPEDKYKGVMHDIYDINGTEQMKKILQLRHYSPRTEETYTDWVERYFKYADRQKLEWNAPEIEESKFVKEDLGDELIKRIGKAQLLKIGKAAI